MKMRLKLRKKTIPLYFEKFVFFYFKTKNNLVHLPLAASFHTASRTFMSVNKI
jgi:hypothetical protein